MATVTFQHSGPEFETAFQQPLDEAMAAGGWQGAMAMLGAAMSGSVRHALDGLGELARSRRIGKYEARWMGEPLQQLYESGIAAQRLSHLSGRQLPVEREPVSLNEVIEDAIVDHQTRRPRHHITGQLAPVDVMAEPQALVSIADALIAWGCTLGHNLQLRLAHERDSQDATLHLGVSQLQGTDADGIPLDSVEWLLLWQLSRLEGVKVWRSVAPGQVRAVLRFGRTMQQHSGFSVLESEPEPLEDDCSPHGTTIWCVSPQGTAAAALADTLAHHLPVARVVDSVAALAAELPRAPDCVLSTREILISRGFAQWRHQAQSLRGRSLAVVEVSPEDGVFEIGGFGPDSLARVSAGTLSPKLLGAVVSEMGRLTESVN